MTPPIPLNTTSYLSASFPVGETGTNVTTVTFGHRSGKLLATGSEDNTIHIYVIGQMTSLLVRVLFGNILNEIFL